VAWHGREINKHPQQCDKCKTTKKDKRPTTNFCSPLPQCTMPNQRVHMDLFGPLKTCRSGNKHILCIMNVFSKYLELVGIPDKTAATIASAVFSRWLCRHGLPLAIVSDGAKEFCNGVVNEKLKLMPIKNSTISPYHPQTNTQLKVCNLLKNPSSL
jgi:hypothetical protein